MPAFLGHKTLTLYTHNYATIIRMSPAMGFQIAKDMNGYPRDIIFTEAPAEFQHVNSMIVQIWQVKRDACYARVETFTEAMPRLPQW